MALKRILCLLCLSPAVFADSPTMHYANGLKVVSSADAHVSMVAREGATTHLELTSGSVAVQAPAGSELLLDLGGWHLRAGNAELEAQVSGERVTVHCVSGTVFVRDDAGESYPLQPGSELSASSPTAHGEIHPFVAQMTPAEEQEQAAAQAQAQAQAGGGGNVIFSLPFLLNTIFRF